MRYIKKIPAADIVLGNKLIAEGWKKLKEPSNLIMSILLSVPFMFINAIIFIAITSYLYPPLKELLNSEKGPSLSVTIDIYLLIYVAIIFVFMTAHEFLHACFIPNVLKSDKI
ncbi:MAG: DUF3267 domain-containing protein, partial [Acetobacterium sp.]